MSGPGVTDEAVQAVYAAITEHVFAPHELPLDSRLIEIYREQARLAVLAALPNLVAERDARIRVLEGQVTEFARASSSLLRRYNLYDMPEDDSRRWQQLSDAILRSDVARTALEKPNG